MEWGSTGVWMADRSIEWFGKWALITPLSTCTPLSPTPPITLASTIGPTPTPRTTPTIHWLLLHPYRCAWDWSTSMEKLVIVLWNVHFVTKQQFVLLTCSVYLFLYFIGYCISFFNIIYHYLPLYIIIYHFISS